jgi:hypothetical protein
VLAALLDLRSLSARAEGIAATAELRGARL